jgi:hypothetical protein
MSQLADLTCTFKDFQKKYNWSLDETIYNFLEVLDSLEWNLNTKFPLLKNGKIDYEAVEKLEKEEAKKLLQ